MQTNRTSVIFALAFVGLTAAMACGGNSSRFVDGDDDAGSSGDSGSGGDAQGGSSNGGTSGVAGTTEGGSSSGGTSAGGTSAGGTSAGGTSAGGSSAGGSSAGGVSGTSPGGTSAGGVAGTSGGAAGAGGICSLPIDPGPCRGSIPAWGFDGATRQCREFTYGGCDGNENNFATLAECEAACGGDLGMCPPRMPAGNPCPREEQLCTYDPAGCLCRETLPGHCAAVDPECLVLDRDADVSEIVVAPFVACKCTGGVWVCSPSGPSVPPGP